MKRLTSVILVGFLILLGTSYVASAAPAIIPSAAPHMQKKWDDTLAAARKEGVLSIYGEVIPGVRSALIEKFQAVYGIKLEFVIGRTAEIANKWKKEHDAGMNLVDIFHAGSGNAIQVLKPQGAFQPIEPFLMLQEVLDPKAWPDGKIRYLDKAKTVVALTNAWTSGVAVNTDLVKEGQLTSYKDLLKPEWKGKVALFDPIRSSAAASWAAYIVIHAYGRQGGIEYLKQFAATNPAPTRDVRQLVEWVAKGKYAIGVGVQHALTMEFKKKGTPITINRFIEGGAIQPGSGCVEIAATPPHPNAAAVYLNWILSREGQTAFNKPAANPPVRLDVKIEGLDPIKMVRPGDKAFLVDEDYIKTQREVQKMSAEIFKALF